MTCSRKELVTGTVILEDNTVDAMLDDAVTYSAVTNEYPMGVNLTSSPHIPEGGLSGTLDLVVISNAPHTGTAVAYLRYLTGSGQNDSIK